MASPIKTTPILSGKDALYFYRQLAKQAKRKPNLERKKLIQTMVDQVLENSKSLTKF